MKKAVSISILVLEIFLLVLVEDAFLWLGPTFLHHVLRPWRVKQVESRCSELKLGISQADVIARMEKGNSAGYEYEVSQAEDGTLSLEFGGETGVCQVTVDQEKGAVTSAVYRRFQPVP